MPSPSSTPTVSRSSPNSRGAAGSRCGAGPRRWLPFPPAESRGRRLSAGVLFVGEREKRASSVHGSRCGSYFCLLSWPCSRARWCTRCPYNFSARASRAGSTCASIELWKAASISRVDPASSACPQPASPGSRPVHGYRTTSICRYRHPTPPWSWHSWSRHCRSPAGRAARGFL